MSLLAPDNEFMGASVTQALVNAINGEGTIVMTQGALGHTGAQGRAKRLQVGRLEVPESPGARRAARRLGRHQGGARIWETLLTKYPKIDAAFFHNDDMALAASKVMQAKGRTETKIGGVDAMPPGDQGGAGRPDVRHRAQPVLPHSWRRGHRRRVGGHQRRQDRNATFPRTSSPTAPSSPRKTPTACCGWRSSS